MAAENVHELIRKRRRAVALEYLRDAEYAYISALNELHAAERALDLPLTPGKNFSHTDNTGQ